MSNSASGLHQLEEDDSERVKDDSERVMMQAEFNLIGELGWGKTHGFYLKELLPVRVTKYYNGVWSCASYLKKEEAELEKKESE